MKVNLPKVLTTAASGRIPYNYVVGGPSSSSGVPVDMRLSLDPDFKKTILKGVAMLSASIVIATAIDKLSK